GPALWPALLNLHGRVLTTTPGGVCHACTSRPRPFRGVPQRRDVVAVSLFLAPPLSRRCSHNSTASHPDAGFVHSPSSTRHGRDTSPVRKRSAGWWRRSSPSPAVSSG